MLEKRISVWKPWHQRGALPGMKYPGIYIIAMTEQDLTDVPFRWNEDIIYIGVTNSAGGLTGRLRQFDHTIGNRRDSHGGAQRVRYRHSDYELLSQTMFVSVLSVPCQVTSKAPHDLRIMGDVLKLEYECFAEFVEQYGRLPEFNDMKRSPKR